MKKIIEFLKKIFRKFFHKKEKNTKKEIKYIRKLNNINWELIDSLKEYDIVFVEMRNDEIERNNIPEEHQVRPFLIYQKKPDTKEALGYYFTSNINNYFFRNQKYNGMKLILNKEKYNLTKHTMIQYEHNTFLPYENIKYYISSLNNRDISKLKKYKLLLTNGTAISNKENIIIEIGDIINKDDKDYLIYQMDNTNCYCYNINNVKKDDIDIEKEHNYIRFNNKFYYINFDENKIFKNTDTLSIVNRFNEKTVDLVRQNKKDLKHNEKLMKYVSHPKTKKKKKGKRR